ncbi:MAG: hypothetical protein P0Y65_13535 [Candidatus Devosia phytovorans]|uniref:DUF2147 domain-containing protein n=1 Tax=Candidatus Devosia phytovorans TaxID=3121372 RepID=A0AAJ5VR52_9HYPH|nr:hypothetical protein [Devosia sp.]WEK03221.1 MAG: hypothetical protein P0Y65_13535 [Devosia sp.]
MRSLQVALAVVMLGGALSVSATAQDAALDPNGTFVDQWGTTFTFSLCGEGDLCGTLDVLKGDSATEENLAFVGKQVMQAQPEGPSEWKGALEAGGLSAAATVTQTGPDTIDIEGCRAAILCETITYTRQ